MIRTLSTFVNSVLVLVFLTACSNHTTFNDPEQEKEIDNLMIFAKSYGLVKYFHPSDNAASIDWDLFFGIRNNANTRKYR